MEDQGDANAAASRRWTCEACGCHTNTEADTSCSICGTSNNGPSLLRRAPAGRPNWFPRAVFGRVRGLPEEFGIEDESDLWESVVDGVDMAVGDEDRGASTIESLAMEVSGMANAARRSIEARRQGIDGNRQRILDAARAFSQQSTRRSPEELLQQAIQNSSRYRPQWISPAQMADRTRNSNDIHVGEGRLQNLAHVPAGATEGRAVRASKPIPRSENRSVPRRLAPFSDTAVPGAAAGSGNMESDSQPAPVGRRTFGFRVAFDHPSSDDGGSLGGCYLVGVTVNSFNAFGEQNGLAQSAFFWGIEDGGTKYEGTRYAQPNRGNRRISASYAMELNPSEVPMNDANVIFGCRDVVTVVCDLDSRTLSFWRNETSLGTLVYNLPRTGNLFPVVVPYNCGVAVAITGLDEYPLPILRAFVDDSRRVQREKEEQIRRDVKSRRKLYIQNGKVSSRLEQVLAEIFSRYAEPGEDLLRYCSGSRLLYRCGVKLDYLDELLREPESDADVDPHPSGLSFKKFYRVIEKILKEDEIFVREKVASPTDSDVPFQDSDCVALVDGYDKYEDAAGGPLRPGDRGTVVELQLGPNGERRSVRVLYNGRRWWYQPQAIISVRSGLIDSPGVWFVSNLVRAHAYNHRTLEELQGKPLSSAECRQGDAVVPAETFNPEEGVRTYGRISSETSSGPKGSVSVEYVDPNFAKASGSQRSLSSISIAVDRARISSSRLYFASVLQEGGLLDFPTSKGSNSKSADDEMSIEDGCLDAATDKIRTDLSGVARLDGTALDSVMKECKKNPDSLASMFSAGLPDALLSATDMAWRQINSLEPREDLPERISVLGSLTLFTADQLFSDTPRKYDDGVHGDGGEESSVTEGGASRERLDNQPLRSNTEDGNRPNGQPSGGRRSRNVRGLVASIQHRRSLILSLMSRGGPRHAGAPDLGAVEGALGRELALHSLPPPFGGAERNFGEALSAGANWEDAASHNRSNQTNSETKLSKTSEEHVCSTKGSFLDKVRRKIGFVSAQNRAKSTGVSHLVFQKRVFEFGILTNSLAWTKALVEEYEAKASVASGSILRFAADEDGKSLLTLAVSFGCSAELVKYLLSCGAQATSAEVIKSVQTEQLDVLGLLLKHCPIPDDLDMSQCSARAVAVIQEARRRQESLDRKMREAAGTFMLEMLRRLLKLSLHSRRHKAPRLDTCSRVISEMLVGNVLFRALRAAEKDSVNDSTDSRTKGEDALSQDDALTFYNTSGLLNSLPASILKGALLSSAENATTFFLLVEDHLCSKEMADAAAGLSALLCVLRLFPSLRGSFEMERFGMMGMASFHEILASNRCAEILSRQLSSRLEVSSSGRTTEQCTPATNEGDHNHCSGIILCPKKHHALLHVTRHSSFRCDLCGRGVDRGRPMHGCRDCDWDACEECTDMAESGLLKCSAIRELALECKKLLSDDVLSESGEDDIVKLVEDLDRAGRCSEVESVSLRLVKHDTAAVEDLARLLKTPGRITVHQFLTLVLPSLHESCVSRPVDASGMQAKGHRRKKPKVGMYVNDEQKPSHSSSPISKQQFCREVVNLLIIARDQKVGTAAASSESENVKSGLQGERDDLGTTGTEKGPVSEREISLYAESSDLLRRLQQILSLYESVSVVPMSSKKKSASGTELQALTSPILLELRPSAFGDSSIVAKNKVTVRVEPLLPFSDLELHVIRSCRPFDPEYRSFCQCLASDRAIILERSKVKESTWRVGLVVGYDELSGAHSVYYATNFADSTSRDRLHLKMNSFEFTDTLVFSKSATQLVLAARDFLILYRETNGKAQATQKTGDIAMACVELERHLGTRAEWKNSVEGEWELCTVVACNGDGEDARVTIVTDDGTVHSNVASESMRLHAIAPSSGDDEQGPRMSESGSDRGPGSDSLSRAFPFFSRQRSSDSREEQSQMNRSETVLKRSWSALSLVEGLSPFDLTNSTDPRPEKSTPLVSRCIPSHCMIGEKKVPIFNEGIRPEVPLKLNVRFNALENLPGVEISNNNGITILKALQIVHGRKNGSDDFRLKGTHTLYFNFSCDRPEILRSENVSVHVHECELVPFLNCTMEKPKSQPESRSRKLSGQSVASEDDDNRYGLCDGIDDVCVQCMEVIDVLADASGTPPSGRDRSGKNSVFANEALSKKLMLQLEDPLAVVGGIFPEWCTRATAFAPRVFAYDARKMLLDSSAFGVSRSTFKQQETKINVSKLRQRMASLRGRAVELVGEAFSGGAEDPTALQLQADELYGMEEALGARVRATFRAARWHEHALQVAKGAVRRENLLTDASILMNQYASDIRVSKRRLEVRFDGESGFDAASGDEAGVTRGFYADVAEALLSSEIVAGIHCSSSCSPVASSPSRAKKAMEIDEKGPESSKLPLWIPDMDSGMQVVIPTPRADERSCPGIFPRALPAYHPQMTEVLKKFRFMGRLFAAAMRDGFMFPLPLSSSFLKLVQHGCLDADNDTSRVLQRSENILSSNDLPRPGFVGGEIHAVDFHICRALNRIDATEPPLPRHELVRRYNELANDKNFARIAFGKSYDCSFDEYFQDRTFVDPLDPAQDENAHPLCDKGYQKNVTIFNVREWVDLAKRFVLNEGVVAQAAEFRNGVEDFFPSRFLRLFTPEELQRDVCGVGDNVEKWDESAIRKIFKLDGGKGAAEALVAVAAIGGEGGAALSRRFGPSSPTISYLVKALLEATPKQRRQFLSFVTSVPIVTPGRIEVVPMVSPAGEFLPMRDPTCLPRANTCARRLYLPKFDDYESFAGVLWAVVREESKFKGFYEWRG